MIGMGSVGQGNPVPIKRRFSFQRDVPNRHMCDGGFARPTM